MHINIEIQCDNAAFHEPTPEQEIGRILANLATKLQDGLVDGYIVLADTNGNRVGVYDTTPDVWDD